MKRTLKGIFSLLILGVLILNSTVAHASIIKSMDNVALTNSVEMNVRAKQELAERYSANYKSNFKDSSEALKRSDKALELITKISAGEINENEGISELETMGMYTLETETIPTMGKMASTPSYNDMFVNNVLVVFDSYNNEWIVSGGGYWSNCVYENNVYTSSPQSIGGADGVGVRIYNTSGTYNSKILRSLVYASDGGSRTYNGTSPTKISGTEGVYFYFQDSVLGYYNGGKWLNSTYLGKHFSCAIVYDSNFKNFHGYAIAEYTHTFSSARITGVGFAPFSFNISIDYIENSRTIASSGEKIF